MGEDEVCQMCLDTILNGKDLEFRINDIYKAKYCPSCGRKIRSLNRNITPRQAIRRIESFILEETVWDDLIDDEFFDALHLAIRCLEREETQRNY